MFQSALLDPPGRYTGNNFLFKGGLIQVINLRQSRHVDRCGGGADMNQNDGVFR